MHRIMTQTNTSISFTAFNTHNFHLDIYSDSLESLLDAVAQVEGQYPSEIEFHVPESYHRQAIGTGGLVVQSIMRKFNVYIQFVTNQMSLVPNGFTHSVQDNVLMRCPASNAKYLNAAKNELLQVVADAMRMCKVAYLIWTRSQRRILLARNSTSVHEIERKTITFIDVPVAECSNDECIEITGSYDGASAAHRHIRALFPAEVKFRVAKCSRSDYVISEQNPAFYKNIVAPLKVAMDVEVQVFSHGHQCDDVHQTTLVLSFADPGRQSVLLAVDTVKSYLRQHNLDIIDVEELNDGGSTDILHDTDIKTNENTAKRTRATKHVPSTDPSSSSFTRMSFAGQSSGSSNVKTPSRDSHVKPFLYGPEYSSEGQYARSATSDTSDSGRHLFSNRAAELTSELVDSQSTSSHRHSPAARSPQGHFQSD